MTDRPAAPSSSAEPGELPLIGGARAITAWGLAALLLLFLLTATDAFGRAPLWENGHWTLAAAIATALAHLAFLRAMPGERAARGGIAAGFWLFLVGQLAWDLQVVLDIVTVPAISDVFYLSSVLPIAWGIVHGIRARLSPVERLAFAIDGTTLVSVIALVVIVGFGSDALITADPLAGLVMLLYPISFLGAAGVGALGVLQLGIRPAWTGITALLAGMALMGLAWVLWLEQAVAELPPIGSPVNYLFSVALFGVGVGSYRLSLRNPAGPRFASFASMGIFYFPIAAAIAAFSALIVVHRFEMGGVQALVELAAALIVALAVARQSLLLAERRRVARREQVLRVAEHAALQRAEAALVAQQASEARYREVVDVFGRLAEQLSFAADEDTLVRGGVAALRRLIDASAGDMLLVNPSQDHLIVRASWGPAARTVGEPIEDVAPARCLGIRRGSVYAVPDVGDDLMLPCPAHPMERGSLMCVPMLALGETIGVVHLGSPEPDSFSVDDERQASRVAEQVALAIANSRLIKTMESMALTDPLTRLHNARFFDPFLDRELAAAQRDRQSLGVIMIDLDRFKEFNDLHGHPAGDEALRVFARAALTVLRDSDTLARYGGEEFVVAVRDTDVDGTVAVAERIRAAVERSSIEVRLGSYASVTASFGVAATSLHGYDRLSLLKSADRALYRAKREGRNRVVVAGLGRAASRVAGAAG